MRGLRAVAPALLLCVAAPLGDTALSSAGSAAQAAGQDVPHQVTCYQNGREILRWQLAARPGMKGNMSIAGRDASGKIMLIVAGGGTACTIVPEN